MIALLGGEPGGPQQAALAALREKVTGPAIWIATDQLPGDGWEVWQDQPWEALAAWADRMAHPDVPSSELRIATLNGFRGPANRPPTVEDHTDLTMAASASIINGEFPALVAIGSLSRLYEIVQSEIAGSIPSKWGEKATELAHAMASNAIDHFVWDLQRSRVPVVCTAWTREPAKHKPQLYVPRAVYQIADTIVLYEDEITVPQKKSDAFDAILEVSHAV